MNGNMPFGSSGMNGKNPFEDFFKRKPAGGEASQQETSQKEPERFDSKGRPVKNRGKGVGRSAALFLLLVLVLFTGKNCYYVLDEDNYAVMTTLGNPQAVSQAGLHFKIPYIQHVRKVSKEIMGMAIGYIPETGQGIDEESIMITKDFNFVNTDFYLEYMVNDPVKYLYASTDPEATLKMLAQSYIRDTVGIYNVDDVITTGKAAIQSEIKEKLTNRMIAEDIGLSVVNITIQDAFPPTTEVMSAFKNVENAKQGKETAINNANKDRNEKIPQAEAECDQIIKNAEAEKQARINEAEGQVSRFEQMYAEYSKYPLITKQRMFYETMEELLPELKLYIVDDNGTQKLLPLESFTQQMQSAPLSGGNAAGSVSGGSSSSNGSGNSSQGGSAGGSGSSQGSGSGSPAAE